MRLRGTVRRPKLAGGTQEEALKIRMMLSVALGALTLAAAVPAPAQAPAPAARPAPARDPNAVPSIPGQNVNGLRVYLRAGLKTHGPGYHDYPQWLADFSKTLTAHGAVVDGSYHAPFAAELAKTDVLVMYKGDAGYLNATERAALQAFVKRGGGIVAVHDVLCGPDPAEMATYLGAGKKHGEVNYTLDAKVPYTIVDKASPIMKGMSNITLNDEAFYSLTWSKIPVHVLATATIDDTPAGHLHAGEVVPQIWTYEHPADAGKQARAFVWMQGHTYANFAKPEIEGMLLRGIAWAGHHPVDELVDYKPPAAPARPARAPAA
jgi:type 1 glutamine amidotransferase